MSMVAMSQLKRLATDREHLAGEGDEDRVRVNQRGVGQRFGAEHQR